MRPVRNEVTRTRFRFFAVLLSGIVLAHAIVILGFLWRPWENGFLPAPPPPPAEPQLVLPEVPHRYRQPSTAVNFAAPFRYDTAVDGTLRNLPLSREARTGFLADLDTRHVLWMKDARRAVPVASMVKMMTLLLTFETLENNHDISLNTMVQVTPGATKVARTGIIWLDVKETLPLSSLLKALTIKSANDAAYQVAEFIGQGDVAAFVARMNRRAEELGMPGTMFISPHGLPGPNRTNSLSSAEGMVILGERLLEYPTAMEWTSTQQTSIDRPVLRDGHTILTTTNHLVNPRYPGVDGMKTGFTRDAGFCLTFTACRNGRRLMGCVTGFKTARERDSFCRKLLDWGFERTARIDAGQTEPPPAGPVSSPSRKTNN
ncbi:MAG: D-alanyl-D-alanine carboxypeptidase [Lentisphaeria bacterium]|nr:D-alanyl-D-alanine carboxypeptidase [Lentisphaeria bacterium]